MTHQRLPFEPLRRYVTLRGTIPTLGWRNHSWQATAWYRAKRHQSITPRAADRLCTDLGVHPCQLWPQWFEQQSSLSSSLS